MKSKKLLQKILSFVIEQIMPMFQNDDLELKIIKNGSGSFNIWLSLYSAASFFTFDYRRDDRIHYDFYYNKLSEMKKLESVEKSFEDFLNNLKNDKEFANLNICNENKERKSL